MLEAGFIVMYRWRLKPGCEQDFVEAWSEVTQELLSHGSRGSRLHRGSDGIWYAYAQWPSAETRRRAFDAPRTIVDARVRMQEAVAEHFPEVTLEVTADFLGDT